MERLPLPARGSEVAHEEARFETTTRDLLALAAWLEARGITHVVMEATGGYWKSVRHILEAGSTLILANAHEVHSLPGRKSNTSDARWLADFRAHGLVRASFMPPEPVRACAI